MDCGVLGASYFPQDLVFGMDEAAAFLQLVGLLLRFFLHFESIL